MMWSLACSGVSGIDEGAAGKPAPGDPLRPSTERGRPSGAAPNVLLVIADDVGVDKVAAYGEHPAPPATPTLDGLAAEGILYRNVWSYPSCSPTRASLMTGRHARRTGIGQIIDSWKDEHQLAHDEVTMAEVLRAAPTPYATSLAGKWHLGSTKTDVHAHASKQGFQWAAGTLGNLKDNYGGSGKNLQYGYTEWLKIDNGETEVERGYITTDTVDDAIARIAAMPEPWLLVLSFNAAHYPTHVPPKKLHAHAGLKESSSEIDKYDAMVEAMDHELGRLLDTVDAGVLDRTTLIFLGDNGTPDFGVAPPFNPERAKGTMFEGGINVPMIVTGAGVSVQGESRALAHTVDILPTVAELAGAVLTGPDIDGTSLVATLSDLHASVQPTIYSEKFRGNGPAPFDKSTRVVRDDRFKLVRDMRDGKAVERLYDLKDRSEEGPNLLRGKRMPTEAKTSHAALSAELDRLESRLTYGVK